MSEGEESEDFKSKPIAASKLLDALNETLDVFGPFLKDATLLELKKGGFDLESGTIEEYTLSDLSRRLGYIFGKDGTEVIIDQIAKRLVD